MVILITGASRGIGRETARKFHENGYNVIINYNKNEKAALDLHSMLPNSIVVKADVSVEAEKAKREETMRRIEKITSYIENL